MLRRRWVLLSVACTLAGEADIEWVMMPRSSAVIRLMCAVRTWEQVTGGTGHVQRVREGLPEKVAYELQLRYIRMNR